MANPCTQRRINKITRAVEVADTLLRYMGSRSWEGRRIEEVAKVRAGLEETLLSSESVDNR